jgi:predicted lipid carrier protein YhbT
MPADSSIGSAAVAQDQAREILERIDQIKHRPVDPRFGKFTGSYLFDVEGVGAWKIAFENGSKTVIDGAADAECVIHSDADLFLKIARGEQNLLTAFMQGRLDIEGDMALAQKLNSVLPSAKKDAESHGGAA